MYIPFFSNLFLPRIRKTAGGIKPIVLLSLDGWGIAPPSSGNAMDKARLPNWKYLTSTYPNTSLIASGESVGLPAGEVGNSEVGHLTQGTGRIIFESLLRINMSIEKGTFYVNSAFLATIEHAVKHSSRMHLIGLVGSGNVHSSTKHLLALIDLCKRSHLHDVALHLFLDGRDAPPHDGVHVIAQIEYALKESGVGRIASISGRYYAMDRNQRYERTMQVYDCLTVGSQKTGQSASDVINASYKDGKTDEFIEPTVILDPAGKPTLVSDNDACIFFNFRVDRPRQLTRLFVAKPGEFESFVQKKFLRKKTLQNLFFTTMTQYQHDVAVSAVAFPTQSAPMPLGQVLADNKLLQMHMAESEKERMVTYYFNGLSSELLPGEDICIVPSPKVETYDKRPAMSIWPLYSEFVRALAKNRYHFFILNIANADMVAHSGKIGATIKALEIVDTVLGKMVHDVLALDGTVCITADHGNAEELLTYDQNSFFYTTKGGAMNTEHSNNPVPFVLIGNQYEKQMDLLSAGGSLADVAPTILDLFKLPLPKEMSGKTLLKKFQNPNVK